MNTMWLVMKLIILQEQQIIFRCFINMLSRFPTVMDISGFLLNRELFSVKSEFILPSKVAIMCYFPENIIIRERKVNFGI